MNYLQRLEFWGEHHHPKYMDVLRIAFGIFLLFKGIEFANNTAQLALMVSGQGSFNTFLQSIIVHYVLFAHIAGGFLIAVGLLTRLACIIQIPIVLGAIVFVRWDMMQHFSAFMISLLTLLLLIYFLVIGNGPWSLEHVLFGDEEKKTR